MMPCVVERLDGDMCASLVVHFFALPLKDRSLRFGSAVAPTLIAAYVDGIDFSRDAVFGVKDGWQALVGAAHLAIEDNRAELALSVLPSYRTCGIGSSLFARALAHARNRRIGQLFMHCRIGNAPIMRIAQRFGMDIIAAGGDADAYLQLPSAYAERARVEAGESLVQSAPPLALPGAHETRETGLAVR
jgi:GNAT superfamily N-acetyltransferase